MCGYDALVAVAIVVLAAGGSQSIGPVAPATTAIAQDSQIFRFSPESAIV